MLLPILYCSRSQRRQGSCYLLIRGTNDYESDPISEISCFLTNNPISVERTALTLTPYLAPFAPHRAANRAANTRYEIEIASRKRLIFASVNHAIRPAKTQHNKISSALIEHRRFPYPSH